VQNDRSERSKLGHLNWVDGISNEAGSSLVALMASFAIILVVAFAAMGLGTVSQNELRWIDDKAEADGLHEYLHSIFRDGSVCTMILTQSGSWIASAPATFTAADVGTATPPTIDLINLPSAAAAAAPPIITVGLPLQNRPELIVTGIRLQVESDLGSNYGARIFISFGSVGSRSIRPIEIRASILATGGAIKTITGCQPETGTATGIRTLVFFANGSFTVPSGTTELKITAVGGGGGGGGGVSAQNPPGLTTCVAGGGGGGGATAICTVTVVPGNAIAVNVGAGGLAGLGSGAAGGGGLATNGGAGTLSSFGASCSAGGGSPGTAGLSGIGLAGSTLSVGGAGGLGITGASQVNGGSGSDGTALSWCGDRNLHAEAGFGGSTFGAGHVYGGGGSGGETTGLFGSPGLSGQSGAVFIEWVQ
jgi:hypothetical protein